jgi:hypothetical protein
MLRRLRESRERKMAQRGAKFIGAAAFAADLDRWHVVEESTDPIDMRLLKLKWNMDRFAWRPGNAPPRPRSLSEWAATIGVEDLEIVKSMDRVLIAPWGSLVADSYFSPLLAVPIEGAIEWWEERYGPFSNPDGSTKPWAPSPDSAADETNDHRAAAPGEAMPTEGKIYGHPIGMNLYEAFGRERTLASFQWIDDELSSLPLDGVFAPWWSEQRASLVSRLPENVTQGNVPRNANLPDDVRDDLCKFVLMEELFWELSNGPEGGTQLVTGDKVLGTLPPLEGGWGSGAVWARDVLRWFRGWVANPLPSGAVEEVAATLPSTLEDAKQHRLLECLHGEYDLQEAYAAWCEEQDLPNVVVRGPYRNRDEPDRLLFLVGLDLSRTSYRLNRKGLEVASARVGMIKSWPASKPPDDQIPDSHLSRIAADGYLDHESALEVARSWLEIALDPEYTDPFENNAHV